MNENENGGCKTCAYLGIVEVCKNEHYVCRWLQSIKLPWCEGHLRARQKRGGTLIGKRHVDGDWADQVNCPVYLGIEKDASDG